VAHALDSGSLTITAGAGAGKTTLLEEALDGSPTGVAWLSCSDTERAPGTLLLRIVDAIARAAPGVADALAEGLGASSQQIDVPAATRELIAELSRLRVEPLVLVVDDAEHLEGAEGSERLINELIRSGLPALRVALASRRPLALRIAKPRAAGQVTELSAHDLAFDSEECAALLRERIGRDPSPELVSEAMKATEGWPLGIVLAAALVARRARDGDDRTTLTELARAPDLRAYLSEELLDSLEPELREAALRSSVARIVTPAVAEALELPDELGHRADRAGVPVRWLGDEAFVYHPLVRSFLLEHARDEWDEPDWQRLHAVVAPAVAAGGDAIGAIEHWLAAARWPEAMDAIDREGAALITTSPELVSGWLDRLPSEWHHVPLFLLLRGQIEWSAGQHERALGPLREAVARYRDAGDAEHEWRARLVISDPLMSTGMFDEMVEMAVGWSEADAAASVSAKGVAWYAVLALNQLGRTAEAESLADRLRQDAETAALFRWIDDVASPIVDLPAGRAEVALERLRLTIRELEMRDPQGRLPVPLAVIVLVLLDIGDEDEALVWLGRCQREAERLGLGFIARDACLQRASLLAMAGNLADAELELERAGERRGTGWRGVSRHKAEAILAAARGDAKGAVAAAERALERVRPALIPYRVWAAVDMATVLAESGASERAGEAVEGALADLDERFPGKLGRYHRARLLATRAWLRFVAGQRKSAYADLRRSWSEAGEGAGTLARAHWRQLEPVVWQALADSAVDAETVLPSLEQALPAGKALITFMDHPEPSVRRVAIRAALASSHPAALSRLAKLVKDADEAVASAAQAAGERLRRAPPPLRFALLGRFTVWRAGWEMGEDSWARPLDARLVRLLLVHLGEAVSEDLIFEALWPGRPPSTARRGLQVAVSRVRSTLDLPDADRSLIERGDGTYRLVLGERDTVDAEEFRAAANAALAERGASQRSLLERTRGLWGGEPLPEERYSDWAAPHRERLLDRYIAVLTALAELHERAGDHAEASDVARELVDLDPLNEGGHRALIAAYARSGRRGHALRQYLECRRALVDELGMEPSDETSRLQVRILAGETV
jgi:ATP/maltotriose-dependent transcriptional regulator MalT/DNA-binding SARP family transcriptional activator